MYSFFYISRIQYVDVERGGLLDRSLAVNFKLFLFFCTSEILGNFRVYRWTWIENKKKYILHGDKSDSHMCGLMCVIIHTSCGHQSVDH